MIEQQKSLTQKLRTEESKNHVVHVCMYACRYVMYGMGDWTLNECGMHCISICHFLSDSVASRL